METIARQRQRHTLHAVVYPVCVCGKSYPSHLSADHNPVMCREYSPSRPIVDYGCVSDKVVEV